jgi:2-oxoisovalerate dehydrogenase E1 component
MKPDAEEELNDVYAVSLESEVWSLELRPSILQTPLLQTPDSRLAFSRRYQIKLCIKAWKHHPNLILMGQDIAEYGGAFKITEGFVESLAKSVYAIHRLCESAIVGSALGLSLEGYKSVMEMQFADFASVGFNQIVNNLAKIITAGDKMPMW